MQPYHIHYGEPASGKAVVRGSWLVKNHHYTRLGCGQISLAGFPRGSPYVAPMGPFIMSRRRHGPCIFFNWQPYSFHRLNLG